MPSDPNVRNGWKADIALAAEAEQAAEAMREFLHGALFFLCLAGCTAETRPRCGPLPAGWITPAAGKPHLTVANTITLQGQQIRWNVAAIDEPKLAAYLRETAAMNPVPFVIFDPQEAECPFATRVQHVIDANYPCRQGACGQGPAAAFDTAT